MYPLRFQPLFKRYLWGGPRLQSLLGKQLGEGNDYAESWEVVDHGEDQSIVRSGPWQGKSLGQLVQDYGPQLLGNNHPAARFPLLLKFLDAHRNLSVQVHPNNEQARRLSPPDLGKTEAWVVLHAEPNSKIYAGLKPGCSRAELEREIQGGTAENSLHQLTPQPGDCVFIPAGTVHALGAGIVVAEIQQASNTTFRLYDWNRVGADGRPRTLHVEQGLDVIVWDSGPIFPQVDQPTRHEHIRRLVECEFFALDRWRFDSRQSLGGDSRFHLLAILQGDVTIEGDQLERPLVTGEVAMLPASCSATILTPSTETTMLDIYIPNR